jgi:hypothetical protein
VFARAFLFFAHRLFRAICQRFLECNPVATYLRGSLCVNFERPQTIPIRLLSLATSIPGIEHPDQRLGPSNDPDCADAANPYSPTLK